ncbi:hypothetical protein [Asanoa iriomotensis]|uniref:hypothetical protein n=1 Tax=Asanoa iriomotensis TaxID=234613 RepID=UPI001941D8B3|nr:hypothetical protein [Asanoa iriomotensis]
MAVAAVVSSDGVWAGHLITNPDHSAGQIRAMDIHVGDTVMFGTELPSVGDGQTITITGVRVTRGAPGLTLRGARIYARRDFGGGALLGWDGDGELDPHTRPSQDLVGATLTGPTDYRRFIMFEFAVKAPGSQSIAMIDLRYRTEEGERQQPLMVAFEVREGRGT